MSDATQESLEAIYDELERATKAHGTSAEIILELERAVTAAEEYAAKLAELSGHLATAQAARLTAEAQSAAYRSERDESKAAHAQELEEERRLRSTLEQQGHEVQRQLNDAISQIKALAAKQPTVIAAPPAPQPVQVDGWDVTVTARTDLGDIRTLQIRPAKGA